jgi:serine/threonine protein kinase
MGEVYLARDTQLDREVALKILTAEAARDPQRLHRFLQEARAASSLSHPNVAHIYEIGEANGAHFIAMEYVKREPLDRKISGRTMPVSEILDIAVQITDACACERNYSSGHQIVEYHDHLARPREGA